MDTAIALIIVLAIWAGIGWAGYTFARMKGYRGPLWAVITMVFGLIALIVLALLPAKA